MPFDGITTACAVGELSALLTGAKIEKIYHPEQRELVFHLRNDRQDYRLLISAAGSHARIHIIKGPTANPKNPSGFCMLLRKHLQNGRICGLYQKDTERIVEMSVDSLDEMGFKVSKKLIVEIMGKHSNITLVDIRTNKVHDSIKRISGDINRYRQLLPGVTYIYPSSGDKLSFWSIDSKDSLKEALMRPVKAAAKDESKDPQDITDITISDSLVAHYQGFSPFFAKALCRLSGIDGSMKASSLSDDDASALFGAFTDISCRIKSGSTDNAVKIDERDKSPVDFYPFIFADYFSGEKFDSLCGALEYYYEHKTASNHLHQRSADLIKVVTTALEKLHLKKKRLNEDIALASEHDVIRLKGELLTANIYRIMQGDASIEVQNYYDGSLMKIALDPLLTPSENIQRYYKKYSKAKTAVKEKNIQLTETCADIDYLESVLAFIENAEDFEELNDLRQELSQGRYLRRRSSVKKTEKASSKPAFYTTCEGFRLGLGKNNRQNDLLTLKTAGKKDLWFHTKDIPGSHVILFTEGKEPSIASIKEAASLAAYHSKGRTSDNVPVDYTLVKHVRKPSGAKPGMVIYDHHSTIYVRPSRM